MAQITKIHSLDRKADIPWYLSLIKVGYEDSEEEPLSEKWGKVTDADEQGVSEKASIGYETFIPTFDIFESSYSYIKDQFDCMAMLLPCTVLFFGRTGNFRVLISVLSLRKNQIRTVMKA